MKTERDVYLQILAYGLTDGTSIVPPNVGDISWADFYSFCVSQAIVGIGLQCVDKLKNQLGCNLNIPQNILFQWIGYSERIKTHNLLLNKRIKELTNILNAKGKRGCILKGQGNSLMYPEPLLRLPGDIDVWIEGKKKEIVEFVHKDYPHINVEYHHMQYPVFDDVEVEVHYYPSFCYNKWHNHRLQEFFCENSRAQFENVSEEGFAVPTVTFNLVFQLSHMMRHFFTQGIGLRHAIDYYYLLQQAITDDELSDAIEVMKRSGMYKFYCAMMWIEQEIFGLSKDKYHVVPHKKAGMLILREMLKGGNFGRQYNRKQRGTISSYVEQMSYSLRYLYEFPSEPISRPFALIWDYVRKHLITM